MSLLDAYDDGTLQAAKAMDAAPLPEPVPEPKHSGWTVVPRFLAGAALEVAGNLVDAGSVIGQEVASHTLPEGVPAIPIDYRPEASRPHYEMAREMRPDPMTAGLAENIIFGVGKGLTKAIASVSALGPMAGAGAFGLSEGMTTSEDLANAGVDADTRVKVGAVTGLTAGVSVLIPAAGDTLLKTAGLVAAGGPAAYVAQEATVKKILADANYQTIADQHDPLDPVGLIVSTLLPAAFGAMALRGHFKGKATQEELDAAMVHNTTLKADKFEAETPQAVEAMKQAEESVQAAKPIYEHTGPVGKAITERLMELGTPAEEAAKKGLLWDSFFKVMAAKPRNPGVVSQSPEELMGRYFDRIFKAEDVPEGAMGQSEYKGVSDIEWTRDDRFIAEAKTHFGVTSNPREAGYIMPDGTMLDFTGRHYAEDHPSLRNQRSVDHRELTGENKNGHSMEGQFTQEHGSGSDFMHEFMDRTGAMRVDFNAGISSIMRPPTPEQLRVLGAHTRGKYSATAYIDPTNGRLVDDVEWERTRPADIEKWFADKVGKPGKGALFQSANDPKVQTDTPAFRNWFGDSKVVDAEGNTPPANSRELGSQAPRNGMQERAVRADESGSPELAQSEVAGGRGMDIASIPKDVQERALRAAQEEQDRLDAFDLEAEIKSIREGGNIDLSSLSGDPRYWDSENEEFTDAGLKEIGRLTEAKARDNLRLGEGFTELSDLNNAAHRAQYEAMKSILDDLGIDYTDTSAAQSKYIEVNGYKLRFADHSNMVRDSAVRGQLPIINVSPNGASFMDALESAIGNRGTFDPNDPNILKQSAPVFYSQLSKAIEDAPAKVFGTGKQLKEWMTANAGKLGVKKDEIEATGLNDWLSLQGKVSKEQVQEFLANNGVKVEEVTLGAPTADSEEGLAKRKAIFDAARPELDALHERMDDFRRFQPEEREQARGEYEEKLTALYRKADDAYILNADKTIEPKFSDPRYQLPGGENYRELLLTLPSKAAPPDFSKWKSKYVGGGEWEVHDAGGKLRGIVRADSEATQEQVGKTWWDGASGSTQRMLDSTKANFHSSHFDQPNILAHVRFNERIDADGKRVLFLEEVQADKGQLWRKLKAKIENGTATESDKAEFAKLDAMPFNETKAWTALALKRMIRYAAENGFDRIAWTTGEQQAARYDLSKQVDSVEWAKYDDDRVDVWFQKRGESQKEKAGRFAVDKLDEVIGKELADRVKAEFNGGAVNGEYHGAGLKVGGEGMKGFYDQIIPQVANDVLKKLGGGKVGEVTLNDVAKDRLDTIAGRVYGDNFDALDSKEQSQVRFLANQENEGDALQQPGFDITPALREKVMGGMPLFQGDRGFLQLGSKMSIGLLSSADKSTFLHESGHFFLEVMNDLSKEVPDLRADMDTVREWMGIKGDTAEARAEAWNAMSLEEKRPYHEQWARGFEQYLMDGKAPNEQLKGAFERFRDWLIEIYKSATALNVKVSNEVRQVMDRMLDAQAKPAQEPSGDVVPPPRAIAGEAPGLDLDKVLADGMPNLENHKPLTDPDVQGMVQDMALNESGWAEKGGYLIRSGSEVAGEEQISRTKWVPKAEWWPDRPAQGKRRLNEAQVQEAVRKAIAGEPLKPLEQATVDYMTAIANDRMQGVDQIGWEEFGRAMDDVSAHGEEPTTENVFDYEAMVRAIELNPEAAKSAQDAYDIHNDDAVFMAEIRSIIDEKIQQATQSVPGGAGEGGEKPAESAKPVEQPDPIAAEAARIAQSSPDVRIEVGTDESGQPITKSIQEYLDDAKAGADQARKDVSLIQAAAECLLGSL